MVGQPTGETTVEAKLAFERVTSLHEVTVRDYHLDNRLFDSKVFKTAIKKAIRLCHSAGQMLITKTARPKTEYKTSPLVVELSYCTHIIDGPRPSTLRYGWLP
jgi:hypothetical protein